MACGERSRSGPVRRSQRAPRGTHDRAAAGAGAAPEGRKRAEIRGRVKAHGLPGPEEAVGCAVDRLRGPDPADQLSANSPVRKSRVDVGASAPRISNPCRRALLPAYQAVAACSSTPNATGRKFSGARAGLTLLRSHPRHQVAWAPMSEWTHRRSRALRSRRRTGLISSAYARRKRRPQFTANPSDARRFCSTRIVRRSVTPA